MVHAIPLKYPYRSLYGIARNTHVKETEYIEGQVVQLLTRRKSGVTSDNVRYRGASRDLGSSLRSVDTFVQYAGGFCTGTRPRWKKSGLAGERPEETRGSEVSLTSLHVAVGKISRLFSTEIVGA